MDFQTRIVLLTFAITIVISLIVIPILRRLKVGQMEREDGPESHLKKQGTPTMGGIIMMIAIAIVSTGIYLYYTKKGEIETAKNLVPIVLLTMGFGLVGFIDDFIKLILKNTKGLKPSFKMLGLLFISVAYVLYLVKGIGMPTETYIPILKQYVGIPVYAYIPFAINFTDGIDGLSSSVCTIIITCLAIIATILGVKEIVIVCSIAIGAVLGFLMFNLHPAKVFMGDTGSLFLGGLISGVALYLKMPLLLLLIALVPVIETISVILQVAHFKRTGNRLFRMAPIHHHFELSGWKENKVVVVFSLVTLVLCVISLQII